MPLPRRSPAHRALTPTLACIAAIALALPGCAGLDRPSPVFEERPGLNMGDSSPNESTPRRAMSPASALPALRASHTFEQTEPEPRTLVRTVEHHPPAAALRITVTDAQTNEILRETELVRTPEGALAIERHAADAIDSVFDPPALFVPASLGPGETTTADFTVRSTSTRFPNGSGEGTTTITHAGAETLDTPRGLLPCTVLDTTTSFGVGVARVTIERRAWFYTAPAPETETDATADIAPLGLVAERTRTRVRVFGVTAHDAARASRIAAPTNTDTRNDAPDARPR